MSLRNKQERGAEGSNIRRSSPGSITVGYGIFKRCHSCPPIAATAQEDNDRGRDRVRDVWPKRLRDQDRGNVFENEAHVLCQRYIQRQGS